MTLPVFLHSAMAGAPQLTLANGSVNALLNACLVNGFNTQSVVSATASGGVVTFNFATAPNFSALQTVTIAGASNATVNGKFRTQSAASNQVLVAIPGVPDGAVAGTITMRFSPLGWTRSFSGTGLGAYRQGGSEAFKRFLRIRDSNLLADGGVFFARGYENMSAISTGTGPFPTAGQAAGEGSSFDAVQATGSTADSDPRPWVIVGTPRAFYLMMDRGLSNGGVTGLGLTPVWQISAAEINTLTSFTFGDLSDKGKPGDSYHTHIAYSYWWGAGTAGVSHVARGADGVLGAKLLTGISPVGYTYGASGAVPYPNPSNGGMTLTGPVLCYDSDSPYGMRGFMPGMLCPLEGPYSNAVSEGNQVKPGQIVENVTGVTGRLVLMTAYGTGSQSDMFLKLDEDWGDL